MPVLISQSRPCGRARPHRLRLALVPAVAEAVAVCTAAATVLWVEQAGSTAQERRYFEVAVDHETVTSVTCDKGMVLENKQKLTAICGCLRCKGGSGAIGWRGIRSIGGSHTRAHPPQREEVRCWTAFGAVDRRVRGDQTRTDAQSAR